MIPGFIAGAVVGSLTTAIVGAFGIVVFLVDSWQPVEEEEGSDDDTEED